MALCFKCKQVEGMFLQGREVVKNGQDWHIATKQEAEALVDGLDWERFCDPCLEEMGVLHE